MVRTSDLKSVGRRFKSRSDHALADVVLGSPEFNFSAALVDSQLVCLLPVGILNSLHYIYNVCLFTVSPISTAVLNTLDT